LRESLTARRLKVAKTKRQQRRAALGLLTKAAWVTNHSVAIHDLDKAVASEDDFDALMSAAGLLRCVLENYTLDEPHCDDRIAEGGVLLTSAIDFEKKAEKLERQVDKPDQSAIPLPGERQCPIPGCTKMFKRAFAGWDSHVASARIHPQWHPECVEPEERKKHFKREFPDWMGPS
jgi:hypothetical protein